MATYGPSPSPAVCRLAAPVFRTNARLYASDAVIELLVDVATEPRVAVLVDLDALERSALARIDRVMLLALDALGHAGVQVVLLGRQQRGRAALVHGLLAGSWCVEHVEPRWTLARLRDRLPDVPLVAISDDPDLLGNLMRHDRGIAMGADQPGARSNVVASRDLNVRAALWWIVDSRWKAGLVAWT